MTVTRILSPLFSLRWIGLVVMPLMVPMSMNVSGNVIVDGDRNLPTASVESDIRSEPISAGFLSHNSQTIYQRVLLGYRINIIQS